VVAWFTRSRECKTGGRSLLDMDGMIGARGLLSKNNQSREASNTTRKMMCC
jgi:hypothetical protein